MTRITKIINTKMPLSKLLFCCGIWIFTVLLTSFCGFYFTNHMLNAIVTTSVFCALIAIIVWLFFIKIHFLWKLFLNPILFFLLLILLGGTFFSVYEICEANRKDPISCYRVSHSMPLGDATLVVRTFDLGATTESSASLELERQVFPGIKKVDNIGAGGANCDFELTRLDEHHIRCICRNYGNPASEILSEVIATDKYE